MKIVRHIQQTVPPMALTIGNFDGVHLGHIALINDLKKKANELNLKTGIILFEPQPQEFFQKEKAPGRIMRLSEKLFILKSFEIDFIYCLKFNQSLSQLSATDFIEKILLQQCQTKYLLVGSDFHFGFQRQGNISLLQQYSSFKTEVFPPILQKDKRVSSTLIRQLLQQGNLYEAQQLLDRAYCMSGRVQKGKQLGRTLGFPTINLDVHRLVVPLSGVFAVKVYGLDKIYFGAANLGTRPVVQGKHFLLEVYLFDFNQEIYGKKVTVEFVKKIREEKNFLSLDDLKKQMHQDVAFIQKIFQLA